MRKTEIAGLLALAAMLLAGCVSDRAHPPVAVSLPVPLAESEPMPAARPQEPDLLREAAAQPSAPFEGDGWEDMFDGETLEGWSETRFGGGGEVECRSGVIFMGMGSPFTGINWTNPFPTMNYEVALDAMRLMGSDFFCGLTVPVGATHCTFIVGGWGGALTGISSIDGMDASENETSKFRNFEQGKWYRIRLRVTPKKLEAWIDDEKLVDVDTEDRKLAVRPGEIEMSIPFGIASWQTAAALREIKFRLLE
jgi:hypothetical protein